MKQLTKSGIEFEILTGPEERDNEKLGRVLVKANAKIGSHGYTQKWTQLFENKKGYYITLNKERTFIELPKGEWVHSVEEKTYTNGDKYEQRVTEWVGTDGTYWKSSAF